MTIWELDESPPPRPGQATIVPAPFPGVDIGAMTEVLKAAGIPQGRPQGYPAAPAAAPPARPAPTLLVPQRIAPPAPFDPFVPPGPMGMAAPPQPLEPRPPAAPLPQDVMTPASEPVPPPVNDDFFGRIIKAGLASSPIAQTLGPEGIERAAAVIRLYGDKAWRENSLAGTLVSDVEAGRGMHTAPTTVVRDPRAADYYGVPREERTGGDIYGLATPDQYAKNAEIQKQRESAYRANRREKDAQMRALGELSPGEQAAALLAGLAGALGSPEVAIGPARAAYAGASTLGKIAQGAGINAAVVGTSDPIAQVRAVERGDKKEYSPAEHALATGGAAALGAAIPALGALFRRLGALGRGRPLDGEVLPPSGPPDPRAPRTGIGYEPREAQFTEAGVPLQLDGPRAALEAPRAPEASRQPPAEVIQPSAKVGQPATRPAIEGPRAQPEVRVEADGSTVIRIPPSAYKPPAAPAVAEPAPRAVQPIAEAPSRVGPQKQTQERERESAQPSPLSLDTPAAKGDGPGMQAQQAADQPPDIPDFMRRPMPEKAPGPVEPVSASVPVKPAEAPRQKISLTRIGDFYEAFDADAANVARAIGTTLTSRNGRPMAGIPAHSLERNTETLRAAGYDVEIAPRVAAPEAPAPARPQNKREDMLEAIQRNGDVSRAEAEAALALFQKEKLVRFDGVSGSIEIKHGRVMDRDVIRRAAGLNDASASKAGAGTPEAQRASEKPQIDVGKERSTNGRPEIEYRGPFGKNGEDAPVMNASYVVTADRGSKAGDKHWVVYRRYYNYGANSKYGGRRVDDLLTPGLTKKEARDFALRASQEELDSAGRADFTPTKYTSREYVQPGDPVLVKHGETWRLGRSLETDIHGRVTRADVGGQQIEVKKGESARFGEELRAGYETLMKRHGEKTWAKPEDARQSLIKWRNKTLSGVKEPDAGGAPPREPPPPEPPRAAEPAPEPPKKSPGDDIPPKSPDADKPQHPFSKDAPETEMHAGLGSRAALNALTKSAGPEIIGALVGGQWDHWERYGYPGISWQGALMGAAAVAAMRHRLPGLGKSVVGKNSYATAALQGAGDLMAKTRVGRWFHPTMGLPRDLWERVVVQTKLETRNMQDDLLKIAKHVRENFTPAERSLMSDWIEQAEQAAHGLTGFRAASARVQAQAEALAAHADDLGRKLADVGMIDRNSLLADGTYLHRYYMDKQAADPGFREAAKRMQATATYAMRRGESVEGANSAGFAVGDTAVQWTNIGSGNVVYRKHGWNGGADWFPSKEFTVERIDGKKFFAHRDYTPMEREAMGEIRDANYRFTMGSMEASRDLALGRMFKDIARDPRWASATEKPGWVQVPNTNAQGTKIRKWGELGGRWVAPEVWSALDVIRKPWTSEEWGLAGRIIKGYLKGLAAWKIGKTAYNPATHFNNVMGNVSLSMLTGEVNPAWIMRGIGALRRGGGVVDEARRAGLSLGREANLGDELQNVKIDVGLATGTSGPIGTWGKLLEWWSNNAITRFYQHEDSAFKLGAYMRRRAAGETPEQAVKNVHKVFFDYSDVPIGVQAVRDSYAPFFTYTYKYGQVMLRELAERPWRYVAAFGALSAIDMMSYGLLYGERAKAASDYEDATMPKWLEGRSGFGADKAIRLPFNKKDSVTGEERGVFLNSRYMVPGGDLLDFTANGNLGPSVYPQALGNTIFGGNPLANFVVGIAQGRDTFFDKPIQPFPDTGLWKAGERPTSEVLANWGALARFAAFQALPPILTSIPDKLGQAAVGEGVMKRGEAVPEYMGWTGTDFAGRQKSILQVIAGAMGVKVEDINHAEQQEFKEGATRKAARDARDAFRKSHRNESATDTQRQKLEDSLEDRIDRADRESERIDELRKKAGRR